MPGTLFPADRVRDLSIAIARVGLVNPGEDIAEFVAGDGGWQPRAAGLGADEDEDRADRKRFKIIVDFVRLVVEVE